MFMVDFIYFKVSNFKVPKELSASNSEPCLLIVDNIIIQK